MIIKRAILSLFLFLCWKSLIKDGKSDKKCFLASSSNFLYPKTEGDKEKTEVIQSRKSQAFPARDEDVAGLSLKRAENMIKKLMFHQCFSNPVSCFK